MLLNYLSFRYLVFNKVFSDSLSLIIIIVLNAFDFWVVKNISGRFLVGLRWWNEVNEDGTEEWIYESEHEIRESNIDSKVFWGSLYIAPLFWLVFVFFNIISLEWIWALVCFVSMSLGASNMIGYFKCSGEQKNKMTEFFSEKGAQGLDYVLGNSDKEKENKNKV